MRVLLQNAETKLYFIDIDKWTDDPAKAKDFEEIEHAAAMYHVKDLVYAQIVLEEGPSGRKPADIMELLKHARVRA
jgi:hypothetical protein